MESRCRVMVQPIEEMKLTIEQLLHGVIYAGGLAAAITAIGVLLHYLVVRPVRGFIRREIVGALVDIKDAMTENTRVTNILSHKLDDHINNGGHITRDKE